MGTIKVWRKGQAVYDGDSATDALALVLSGDTFQASQAVIADVNGNVAAGKTVTYLVDDSTISGSYNSGSNGGFIGNLQNGSFLNNSIGTANGCKYSGGVAFTSGKVLTVSGGTYARNYAGQYGGAFCVGSAAGSKITFTAGSTALLFSGNTGTNGGAVGNLRETAVSGATFSGNTAATAGGAFYNYHANGADGKVISSVFAGNVSTDGGAVYNKSRLTLGDLRFIGNSASASRSGAIYNSAGGTITFADKISLETASDTIRSDSGASLLISGNSFRAKYAGTPVITVIDASLMNNALSSSSADWLSTYVLDLADGENLKIVTDSDGCFLICTDLTAAAGIVNGHEHSVTVGGTIYAGARYDNAVQALAAESTAAIGKIAYAGGKITVNSGKTLVSNGTWFNGKTASAILISGGTAALYGSTFTNCTGGDGLVAGDAAASQAVLDGVLFAGNTGKQGTAVYFTKGTAAITGSTFSGNTATDGSGGAVNSNVNVTAMTISGSTFTGNVSANGGAIYNKSVLSIGGVVFSGNTAASSVANGGAIYNSAGGAVTVTDTIYLNTIFDTVRNDSGASITANAADFISKYADSPLIYIVDGNAAGRSYGTASWLTNGGTMTLNAGTGDITEVKDSDGWYFVRNDMVESASIYNSGHRTNELVTVDGVHYYGKRYTGATAVLGVAGTAVISDVTISSAVNFYSTAKASQAIFSEVDFTGCYGGSGVSGAALLVQTGKIADVRHSTGSKNFCSAGNGGFAFLSGGTLKLADVILSGNSASAQGGAVCVGSAAGGLLLVDDKEGAPVIFTGNTSTANRGGAVSALMGMTASGGTFSKNLSAVAGGGIYAKNSLKLTGAKFYDNLSLKEGGAVYVDSTDGNAVISGGLFSGNSGTAGGALYNAGGTVTVAGTTFAGNSAGSTGGAVNNNFSGTARGKMTLDHVLFAGNTGANGAGFYNICDLTLNGGTFTGNAASSQGGAIYNSSGAVITITDTVYFNALTDTMKNDASVTASAADFIARYADAPLVYIIDASAAGRSYSASPTWLTNGSAASMTLDAGAYNITEVKDSDGWYFVRNDMVTLAGIVTPGTAAKTLITVDGVNYYGPRYNPSAISSALSSNALVVVSGIERTTNLAIGTAAAANEVILSQVDFYGASQTTGSDYSGGLLQVTGGKIARVLDSGAHDNLVDGHGGFAFVSGGTLELRGVVLSGNTAKNQGGAVLVGSAAGGSLLIDGTAAQPVVFAGNTAGTNGGAVSSLQNAVISGATFTGNRAVNGGAFNNSGTAVVSGSTFSGNIAGTNGGAINNSGASLTIDGSKAAVVFATASDTVFNQGTVRLDGAITVNASLLGTGSYTLNDASLTFANSDTITVAALTAGTGSSRINLSGTAVGFTSQNFSDITVNVTRNTAWESVGVYSVASGIAQLGTLQLDGTDYTPGTGFLTGNSGVGAVITAVDDTLQAESFDTVYLVASGADNVRSFTSVTDLQAVYGKDNTLKVICNRDFYNSGWTAENTPAQVVVNGETIAVAWGVNAFNSAAAAQAALAPGGEITAYGETITSALFYTGTGDWNYTIANTAFTSSTRTAVAPGANGTVVDHGITTRLDRVTVTGAPFSVNDVTFNGNAASVVNGDEVNIVTGSTFSDYLYFGGGTIAGNLRTEMRDSVCVKGFAFAGHATKIAGGTVSAVIDNTRVVEDGFGVTLNATGTLKTLDTIRAVISGSTISAISLDGGRENLIVTGDVIGELSGSTVTRGFNVAGSAEVGGQRRLNILSGSLIGGEIGGFDTVTIASGAELVLAGADVTGDKDAAKIVNNGVLSVMADSAIGVDIAGGSFRIDAGQTAVFSGNTITAERLTNNGTLSVNGTCAAGTTYFSFFNYDAQDTLGTLTSTNGGGVYTAADQLYYYNGLYVDNTLTEAAKGTVVNITVGSETMTALYGVNAFRSSTDARTADANAALNVLNETFGGNFYGNGTTIFAGGTVALTTYGGKLIKGDDDKAGDSSLTITGGTFCSMVVGGNRVSISDGSASVTGGTAALNVSGGTLAAHLVAAGYVINKGDAGTASLNMTESDLTLANITIGNYAVGGAFVNNGTAAVETVNVAVESGTYKSVFGGGWAQKGSSSVGTANLIVAGGSIHNLYAGGTDNGEGNAATVTTANITIGGGEVRNVFLNGKYSRDTVTTATLNVTGECAINWIEGLSHSMAASTASTNTAVNFGANLTVEDILHVDEWNFNTVGTLLDFGTHTADLDGTTEAAVDTVIDFQIGKQDIGEGWTAIAAQKFEGLKQSSVEINGQEASAYVAETNTWTFGTDYTVTLGQYNDTRKALIVTKYTA